MLEVICSRLMVIFTTVRLIALSLEVTFDDSSLIDETVELTMLETLPEAAFEIITVIFEILCRIVDIDKVIFVTVALIVPIIN